MQCARHASRPVPLWAAGQRTETDSGGGGGDSSLLLLSPRQQVLRVSAGWRQGESGASPGIPLPLGVSVRQNSSLKPGGLGCSRRCVGTRGKHGIPWHYPHWASLSPKTFCSRPGGLGCTGRCVGKGAKCGVPPYNPATGCPYSPKRSAQDRGNSGVTAVVWGCGEKRGIPPYNPPTGRPYSPNTLLKTGGDSSAPAAVRGRGQSVVATCIIHPLSAPIPQKQPD